MGLGKWILGGLGWAFLGPLGGILGYFLGNTIEKIGDGVQSSSNNGQPYNAHHGPYRNNGSQNDIDVALIVLIASVMKVDGSVDRAELDYVKQFLLKNYGEEKGKELLLMLRDLVKPETYIDVDAVCSQIKHNTDYTTRYHMVDFLFDLAAADSSFSQAENNILRIIARNLGINAGDFTSIYARHVSSRWEAATATAAVPLREAHQATPTTAGPMAAPPAPVPLTKKTPTACWDLPPVPPMRR